jgi:hypothetical protein
MVRLPQENVGQGWKVEIAFDKLGNPTGRSRYVR